MIEVIRLVGTEKGLVSQGRFGLHPRTIPRPDPPSTMAKTKDLTALVFIADGTEEMEL